MSWPDKAAPDMTRGKVSGTLSNRHERPLQSPAGVAGQENSGTSTATGCFGSGRLSAHDRLWLIRVVWDFIYRVLEKPLHLSKKAGFRNDRGAERRRGSGAFETPAVCDPEARCDPAALRSAAGVRRRLQVLGGRARSLARSA